MVITSLLAATAIAQQQSATLAPPLMMQAFDLTSILEERDLEFEYEPDDLPEGMKAHVIRQLGDPRGGAAAGLMTGMMGMLGGFMGMFGGFGGGMSPSFFAPQDEDVEMDFEMEESDEDRLFFDVMEAMDLVWTDGTMIPTSGGMYMLTYRMADPMLSIMRMEETGEDFDFVLRAEFVNMGTVLSVSPRPDVDAEWLDELEDRIEEMTEAEESEAAPDQEVGGSLDGTQ